MKKIMMSIFAGILSISCMTLPIEGKTRCSSEVSRAADDFYDGYQYDETTGCYYELLPYEDAYVKVFLPKNTEAFMIPAKIAGYPVKEVAIKSYAYGLTDKYAEAYNKLKQINVAKDNAYFSSQNGVLYDKEGTTLRYYPAGKPETSFIVPAKVKDIANFAFISNRYLQTLDTNGLTSIGFGAFYDSNIQKLKINKTLKDIAFGVAIANMPPTFGKCKQLKAFEVDAGNQNFSTIDGVLFNKDCSKLIYYPNAKGQFYTVPNNTKTISQYAFWLSGYDSGEMKQLTIGKHVTNFVDDVRSTTFNGCGKASIRCYKDSYAYTICLQKGMNVITIPEKIALNCVSKTLEKNATYSFKLTTFPSDASRSVTWRTGNTIIDKSTKRIGTVGINPSDFPFNFYLFICCPDDRYQCVHHLPLVLKADILPVIQIPGNAFHLLHRHSVRREFCNLIGNGLPPCVQLLNFAVGIGEQNRACARQRVKQLFNLAFHLRQFQPLCRQLRGDFRRFFPACQRLKIFQLLHHSPIDHRFQFVQLHAPAAGTRLAVRMDGATHIEDAVGVRRHKRIPAFPAFDFSRHPCVPGFPCGLVGVAGKQLLPAFQPQLRWDKPLMWSQYQRLSLQVLVLVLCIPLALIVIAAVCPGKVGGVIVNIRPLAFVKLVYVEVSHDINRVSENNAQSSP